MNNDQDLPSFNEHETAGDEIGSDELLSDDSLRLPESANMLVRLHALRAWLARRHHDATIDVGQTALHLQQLMQEDIQETGARRAHRRAQQGEAAQRLNHAQQALAAAQQRLSAYEEAQSLLEDCVAHTSGERVLVEYYLILEELVQQSQTPPRTPDQRTPWFDAMADVLHRIEHIGIPNEDL
jgi:hypothetical protein